MRSWYSLTPNSRPTAIRAHLPTAERRARGPAHGGRPQLAATALVSQRPAHRAGAESLSSALSNALTLRKDTT